MSRTEPLYSFKALFNSSFASTSRWFVGSSSTSRFVSELISLHSLTFAFSPPLNTETLLSICFVVSPHFARAADFVLCKGREVVPHFFYACVVVGLFDFLLEIADMKVFAAFDFSRQR